MSAPPHYSDEQISRQAAGARRAILAGPTDEGTATFKRLAVEAVPATVGWLMGEANRRTASSRLESAVARTIGWMAATLARNSRLPGSSLDSIFLLARADADRFLSENATVAPEPEKAPEPDEPGGGMPWGGQLL